MTDSLTIVGAGPGLGSSLARRFAAGGWPLGLIALSEQTLEACAADASGVADVRVVSARADVADEAELDAAIHTVNDAIGLGVVIYNASIFQAENALELSTDALQLALNVHVLGALNTAKSAVKLMREPDAGVLVFTINCLALHPQAASTALSIGKGAQLNLALSLEQELASTGIKVAVVTITQPIVAGTAFDPDRIAELYWQVARQDPARLRTRPRVRRQRLSDRRHSGLGRPSSTLRGVVARARPGAGDARGHPRRLRRRDAPDGAGVAVSSDDGPTMRMPCSAAAAVKASASARQRPSSTT